ncbi:hypothetical protein AAFF_G00270320 [Aldrovandia affinis]|uniref:SAMD1-like winged helix (WH) domain-containing protein n=1 Tax=Aldrovandia affinis TaxID=143900 RepID=A0AAD7RB34_9TELE|nr:hypothetical protein AAFF_G00270320 [Aldrovandia affinis]
MSEPMYRDWILETIDSLRSRKARPDLERICRMVRRRHGSDPERTRSELEKLIQEQTVLKVSYKGSISYRNAAKVQRKSRKKSQQQPAAGVETGGDAEITASASQCRDPAPASLPVAAPPGDRAPPPPAAPDSGNSCPSRGAVVCRSLGRAACCATGSGDDESTNSPKDSLPRTGGGGGGGSSADIVDKGTVVVNNNNNGSGGARCGVSGGAREVQRRSSPGFERSSTSPPPAGVRNKTCGGTGAKGSGDPRRKPHAPTEPEPEPEPEPKPKPRAGATGSARESECESEPSVSDLGDRLVDSVRSLARTSRGGGVTAFEGHAPLGLKEILGFLSSQERLSREKLTRSRVKVVLEREVARGRLRRTRFGNITLPVVRRVVRKSPARLLLQSALQDRQTAKKEETAAVAMEMDGSEVGRDGRVCGPRSAGDEDTGASGRTVLSCRAEGETGGRGVTGAGGESVPGERPTPPRSQPPPPQTL